MTKQTESELDKVRIPVTCHHCGAVDYIALPDEAKAKLKQLFRDVVVGATHYTVKPAGSWIDQDELNQAIDKL